MNGRQKSGFTPVELLVVFAIIIALLLPAVQAAFAGERSASSAKLWVGTGTTSITPEKPVALSGHRRTRIARKVESPCTATAVALEFRRGDKTLDQAIMVSCDLISIRQGILERLREKLAPRLPDFDVKKIFLNGTHTHTGPVMVAGKYLIPKDAMQPAEYVEFLTDQICDLAVKAWESRRPGGVSWGLGHAVVAQGRRLVYADGSAKMYGPTHVDNFRHVEGREDHGVEVLFFWDEKKKLIAVAVNVACPSQEIESRSKAVNADFWHETRLKLREKYGKDLCVLAWCGAAGDQSPHLQWREKAENRMRKQRGLTRLEEIARRIARAVDDAYEVAKSDIHDDVPLVHVVKNVKLPVRMVTDEEYAKTKNAYDALIKKRDPDPGTGILYRLKLVIDRYESQKTNPFHEMELHIIRLGDVAIATNQFELFTDYGIQMKSRSKALQTFVIQLVGSGSYVPTTEAVKGGSYSTAVQSNVVGPEGGQVLVELTVEEINKLWNDEKK